MTVAPIAIVLHAPGWCDLNRGVTVQVCIGVEPRCKCCHQRKGLKTGARLTLGLRGKVVLVLVIIAAADHSVDVAIFVVDGDHCAFEVLVADGIKLLLYGCLCRFLFIGIEGGVDLQATTVDGL